MAKRLPRASVNLLMAATVLAWSLAPPPVHHTHQGGDNPCHHHDCDDADDDADDCAYCSHHGSDCGEHQSVVKVATGIGGEASHFHFQWLGFRLTLPDDDPPAEKGKDHSAAKLLFVQAVRESVPQVDSGSRIDTSLENLSLNSIAAEIAAPQSANFRSLLRVTPHPLCDRARHERSGVQLI